MVMDTPTLNEFVFKLLLAESVQSTYRIITETANHLLKTQYCSIHLKVNNNFERAYSTMPKAYQMKGRRLGFIAQAFKADKPFGLPRNQVSKYHFEVKGLNIKSIIYVPLSYKGLAIGVMTIFLVREEKLSEEMVDGLMFFGALSSLAIRRSQSEFDMKQALDMRDQFISVAAHELRTPLTAIHGYAQLLHKRFSQINAQESGWIKELYGQTIKLIYLVNELLESSRVSSNRQKYVIQKCNLNTLAERVITRYEIMHVGRRYDYHTALSDKDAVILADSEKIDQLINHLVDNAEKFSLDEAPIEINLAATRSYFVLRIVNTSENVDKKDFKRIFDRFYRGEKDIGGGMGLGLFLAKNIVKNHRGRIFMKGIGNDKIETSVYFPKEVTPSRYLTP